MAFRNLVEGTGLAEMLAQEVAPFDSQTATRQFVDLYPLTISETPFGHHEVDIRFEAQVAPTGVKGVDHADAHAWVEFFGQLVDGVGCGLEEQL